MDCKGINLVMLFYFILVEGSCQFWPPRGRWGDGEMKLAGGRESGWPGPRLTGTGTA